MTDHPVKSAVYYYYEGETVIITKDDSNHECITIQVYDDCTENKRGAFITMPYSEWQNLVKKVAEL